MLAEDPMFDCYYPSFRDRHITVMGLGRFGGGTSVVQFLLEHGARITLTDLKNEEELASSLIQIDVSRLEELHLGGHYEEDFTSAELIVASPAVPPNNEFLALARSKTIPITTELNLFWQLNPGKTIGITGSNGKSTTSSLLYHIAKEQGSGCWLGGNIGKSLLPHLSEIQTDDYVILELSSFQLSYLDELFTSPDLAIVTNFSPNHLDWHHSLEEYRSAKQSILRWQTPGQSAVLNCRDADLNTWKTNSRKHGFGCFDSQKAFRKCTKSCSLGAYEIDGEVFLQQELKQEPFSLEPCWNLPGKANRENALAAMAASLALDFDLNSIQSGLKRFRPLPHRLEYLGECRGRHFYNDSLATTPVSSCAALDAFEKPIILLAGGYNKMLDLSDFSHQISLKTKSVALMGQTAKLMSEQLCQQGFHQYKQCESLCDAFQWAVCRSHPGDIILLSPGCASYDWFANFEERGNAFRQLVQCWTEQSSSSAERHSPPHEHSQVNLLSE